VKRPAFQFYPADWMKDLELGSCSLAAQGLWIRMMCVAHESDRYGHLCVNGKAMTNVQIINNIPGANARLLRELEDAGVFSRTDDGAIYSRRMVRDEALRLVRAAGGEAGAEHGKKGGEYGAKGGRPKAEKGGNKPPLPDKTEPPLKRPPSSSSSSSSSPSGKPTPPAAAPPPGVRAEVWMQWARHKGKKLTADAIRLQTARLAEFSASGDDPNAVIEQSICNGWAGLFRVGASVARARREPTRAEARAANMDALCGRGNGRTIDAGTMDGTPVRAVVVDLRKPDDDDVGGLPAGGHHGRMA